MTSAPIFLPRHEAVSAINLQYPFNTIVRAVSINKLKPVNVRAPIGSKPHPMRKRTWKYFKRTVLMLSFVYLLVWLFPQLLFAHSTQYGNLILYSPSPLPGNTTAILKKTDRLLSSSELYSTNTPRRIFVCDGYKLYWLLTFGERHSFGCSFSTSSKNVFIPKADFVNDVVLQEKWNATDSRKRSASAIMAHELTHVLIAEYLGRTSSWRLRKKASWLEEGYCDFIARSSSSSLEDGVRSILEPPIAQMVFPISVPA